MMDSVELRDAQALACLASAAKHHDKLLALAVKLAGGQDEGKDLFHEVMLNCHDAIQRKGYDGDRYEFYLLATLRNQLRRNKRHTRTVPVDFQEMFLPMADVSTDEDESWSNHKANWKRNLEAHLTEHAGFDIDARAHLLAQLAAEVKETLSFDDRILLRLHADGYTYREIAAMTGAGHYTRIQRRVAKMKDALQATFGQAWAALEH